MKIIRSLSPIRDYSVPVLPTGEEYRNGYHTAVRGPVEFSPPVLTSPLKVTSQHMMRDVGMVSHMNPVAATVAFEECDLTAVRVDRSLSPVIRQHQQLIDSNQQYGYPSCEELGYPLPQQHSLLPTVDRMVEDRVVNDINSLHYKNYYNSSAAERLHREFQQPDPFYAVAVEREAQRPMSEFHQPPPPASHHYYAPQLNDIHPSYSSRVQDIQRLQHPPLSPGRMTVEQLQEYQLVINDQLHKRRQSEKTEQQLYSQHVAPVPVVQHVVMNTPREVIDRNSDLVTTPAVRPQRLPETPPPVNELPPALSPTQRVNRLVSPRSVSDSTSSLHYSISKAASTRPLSVSAITPTPSGLLTAFSVRSLRDQHLSFVVISCGISDAVLHQSDVEACLCAADSEHASGVVIVLPPDASLSGLCFFSFL